MSKPLARFVFTATMTVAASAYAQPAPPAPKPDVSALEQSGSKHYALAEYDAAIADFKEAYRISSEPTYLYNIAQSYRLKNECKEAATFYKSYLREATQAKGAEPANAAKVRAWITDMETCATKQQPVVTTPPTTPTNPTNPTNPTTTAQQQPEQPEQPETPPPTTTPRPAWMRWGGIAGVSVGVIAEGLAIKFMLDGKSANDDLKTKCATSCTSSEALAIQSDGKAANRNALIFGIAGGAVLAGGAALLVLSFMPGHQSAPAEEGEVSVQPIKGGATVAYGWRF